MARYEGARDFATDDSRELAQQLRKLSEELDRLYQIQQAGGAPRLAYADVARTDSALKTGYVTPAVGTLALSLPPWESKIAGSFCAVERLAASGTVTVRPSGGGFLNDSTGALALPGALRVYLFMATRTGWKAVDDA